jgi:ribosomal protein L16/L10AE
MKKLNFLKNIFKKLKYKNCNLLSFLILRSLENTYLNKNVFESIRRLISRKLKKKIKYILNRLSVKVPIFSKPLKVRMGKGKGKFKL